MSAWESDKAIRPSECDFSDFSRVCVSKKTTTASHGKTAPLPTHPQSPSPQRSRAVQPQLRDLLVFGICMWPKPLTHRFRLGKIIHIRLEVPLSSHIGGALQ